MSRNAIGVAAASSRARRVRLRALACALACAAAASCRVNDAKLWNLGQVHQDDGSIRRIGEVRSDWTHVFKANGLPFRPRGLFESLGGAVGEKPGPIEDPLKTCLENQLELADCDLSAPAARARATEMFARLATSDAWMLGRERAVLELGRLAAADGLERCAEAPPERAADAEAVRAALQELYAAAGVPFGDAENAAESKLAPDAAAQALGALVLDLDGARRALLGCARLMERLEQHGAQPAALRELARALARRCSELALAEALADASPIVRAAALQVNLRLGPAPRAELVERAFEDRDALPLASALEVVRERGWPAELPRAVAPGAATDWVGLCVANAPDPDPQRSVAFCLTLSKLSGAGFHSLRFEDWVRWWGQRAGAAQVPAPGGRS